MSKLSSRKISITIAVWTIVIMMILSPMILSAVGDDQVYAKNHNHKKYKNHHRGNSASQEIGQSQKSEQNSQCVAGGNMDTSCNNTSFQNQGNKGNNALGQQGEKGKGNSANQGIGQSQSSEQNSQCVAGGKLNNSCNNMSDQDQSNSGNNAAAQDGGHGGHGGHGKNSANQGIDQSQKSKQNAQCVSGEDATVSCNNAEFQKEVNSGNDVLGQKY